MLMSEAWPPTLRNIKRKPFVKGTWTTGCNVRGLHGFPPHKGHIIIIDSDARAAQFSNSGYQQDCHCLRCGVTWHNIDGEFLQVVASDEFIRKELEEVEALLKRHVRVTKIIGKELTS